MASRSPLRPPRACLCRVARAQPAASKRVVEEMRTAIVAGLLLLLTSQTSADAPCASAWKLGHACTITFVDCVLEIGPVVEPPPARPPIPVRRDFIDKIARSVEDV
jgi:hypothetical protein